MRVLFLAPQPFYQERGTPIAVRLALEALSKRLAPCDGVKKGIDVLAYGEGENIEIPGVRIYRIPTPTFLRGIRPGISCRKLACDIIFTLSTFHLLWKARRAQYKVVHAVEEAVFIAWVAKHIFGVPYIYDMDSSLALQLTEKWWMCKPVLPLLRALEGLAVRGSIAVAPVCDALEAIANHHGSRHTVMLRDVSLLPASDINTAVDESRVRQELGANENTPVIMYVGNLESYQGIDLLLEAFALIADHDSKPILAIVGGVPESIQQYTEKATRLGCSSRVVFMGPRPVGQLRHYLAAADILVSPRVRGNNTPMKIYSYLHSGRALIATDLPTHRQVLDSEIAVLAAPTPTAFADGIKRLLDDEGYRKEVAESARSRAEKLYTVRAFEAQLCALYDRVEREVSAGPTPEAPIAVGEEV